MHFQNARIFFIFLEITYTRKIERIFLSETYFSEQTKPGAVAPSSTSLIRAWTPLFVSLSLSLSLSMSFFSSPFLLLSLFFFKVVSTALFLEHTTDSTSFLFLTARRLISSIADAAPPFPQFVSECFLRGSLITSLCLTFSSLLHCQERLTFACAPSSNGPF